MKRAFIKALVLDKINNAPVVLLGIEDTKKVVPIWIGPCEAYALAMALEGLKPPRPMTHDLLLNILNSLDVAVDKVVIHSVKDGTFYANLVLKENVFFEEEEDVEETAYMEIDARPSDSMVIAVKKGVPIYVTSEIVNEHSIEMEDGEEKEDEDEKFKKFVENLDIDAFRRMLNERGKEDENPEEDG